MTADVGFPPILISSKLCRCKCRQRMVGLFGRRILATAIWLDAPASAAAAAFLSRVPRSISTMDLPALPARWGR
jgi:hypothetical protein